MSVNKDRPHVLVLPEDEANRQLAEGFHLEVDWTQQRQMQILPVAHGWKKVLNLFKMVHVVEMNRYPHRFMILLIDLDNKEERLEEAKAVIPSQLKDRAFILATLSKPEHLKPSLGPFYETIGSKLAKDCRGETNPTWEHDLLKHNASELDRLRHHVRPILF